MSNTIVSQTKEDNILGGFSVKRLKKTLALGLVFTMCVGMAVGCGGDKNNNQQQQGNNGGDAAEVIKIGGLAPLTGAVAVYGTANKNGADLAFKEINDAGGVNGKMIEFNTKDEKGEAADAITAYNSLLDEGVVAILGDVTSAPCAAVAQESVANNTPMITATGTSADITTYGNNFFRVCYTDPLQGKTMATFAVQNLEAKTAAILYNVSSDYSDGLSKAFEEKAADLNLTILTKESYGENDKDFKTQLTSIANMNPDVLFVPDYYGQVSLIANQAKEVGLQATLLGADGWDGVLDVIGDATDVVEGAYFCNHYSTDSDNEKVQAFINNYKATYNETPNAFAALAYDAAYILADALSRAESMEEQDVIDALAATTYEGVTGKISFDEQGDPIKDLTIIKIVDGQYTFDSVVSAE